jgi:hypothetical protein
MLLEGAEYASAQNGYCLTPRSRKPLQRFPSAGMQHKALVLLGARSRGIRALRVRGEPNDAVTLWSTSKPAIIDFHHPFFEHCCVN